MSDYLSCVAIQSSSHTTISWSWPPGQTPECNPLSQVDKSFDRDQPERLPQKKKRPIQHDQETTKIPFRGRPRPHQRKPPPPTLNHTPWERRRVLLSRTTHALLPALLQPVTAASTNCVRGPVELCCQHQPAASQPSSQPPAQQKKANPQPVQPFRMSGCPTPPTRLLGPAKTLSKRASPFRPAATVQAAAPKKSPRGSGNEPPQVAVGADVKAVGLQDVACHGKLGRSACPSSAGRVVNQRLIDYHVKGQTRRGWEEQSRAWVVFLRSYGARPVILVTLYTSWNGVAFHLQWSDTVSGPRPPPLLWARIYTSCERSPLWACPPDETVAELGWPTPARQGGGAHARLCICCVRIDGASPVYLAYSVARSLGQHGHPIWGRRGPSS